MTDIVVLGAGIGSIPAAFELKQVVGSKAQITVVSNTPYFQFTPSNPWVGVGWRGRKDITVDIASILAKKGDAFFAKPQNPPSNLNWASEGKWVHLAKIAFEKYFMRKIRKGQSEPYFEKFILGLMKMKRLKQVLVKKSLGFASVYVFHGSIWSNQA